MMRKGIKGVFMKKYNVLSMISSITVVVNFFNIVLLEVLHKMNIANLWTTSSEIMALIVLPLLNLVTVLVALVAIVMLLIDKKKGKELFVKKGMMSVAFAILNLILSFIILQYSIIGGSIFSIFTGIN